MSRDGLTNAEDQEGVRHSTLEGETLGYLVSARHLPSAGTVPRQPQAYDSAQGALEDETSMRGARRASKKALLAQTRHVTAQRPPKRLLTLGIHLYADLCSLCVTKLGKCGAARPLLIHFYRSWSRAIEL